jgi:glycosyltransferase involved in cell wall biosynthesis
MSSPQRTNRIDPIILVSVVIPTRGRPRIVQRAVKSALSQTLRQLEVIVVVHWEDLETVDGLESMRDERLRIVKAPKLIGGAEARNLGVQAAQSDWIAFLDDDDEWLPGKLERQLACAITGTAPFPVVCSAYIARSAEGDFRFGRRAPFPNQHVSEYMFCREGISFGENALATSVLFVPRSLMIAVPFDAALRKHQDWDWALRALSTPGTALYYVKDPLSIYHMEDELDRISAHDDWRESLAWCRKNRKLFTPRAFSFFIVTECLTRARQSNASWRDISALFSVYWREGKPTFKSALLGLGYLTISKPLRRMLLLVRFLARHRMASTGVKGT